jgi:hypothetical protein
VGVLDVEVSGDFGHFGVEVTDQRVHVERILVSQIMRNDMAIVRFYRTDVLDRDQRSMCPAYGASRSITGVRTRNSATFAVTTANEEIPTSIVSPPISRPAPVTG